MSHGTAAIVPAAGFRRAFACCVVMLTVCSSAACTQEVDLKQALQVTDVTTGWFDAGIVDGKNKLVPSITFRLRNSIRQDVACGRR